MKAPELPSFEQPTLGDDLKRFYVRRLERLIRLRRDFREDLNTLGVELLDRAIYATYRDCVDNGAERRAQTLMGAIGDSPAHH